MKRLIFLICFSLSFFSHLSSLYADERNASPQLNDVYVVQFLLDGVNKQLFDEELNSGKLPHLKAELSTRGKQVKNAISSFPTVSTSNYQSLVSGLHPGHSGTPHLGRFDRTSQKEINYISRKDALRVNDDFINLLALKKDGLESLNEPQTLFEQLEARGYKTASLYSTFRKGASISTPSHFPLRALWASFVTHNYPKLDALSFQQLKKLFKSKDKNDFPRYSLVALPATDISTHKNGTHSDEVRNILRQFDRFFGEFVSLLHKQGIYDKTYLVVTADHGAHDTKAHLALKEEMWNTLSIKPNNPMEKDFNIYVSERGVSSSQVYLKSYIDLETNFWKPLQGNFPLDQFEFKSTDKKNLLHYLLTLPGIEFVIVRNGSAQAQILSRRGELANIHCSTIKHQLWCSYTSITDTDPLGYLEHESTKRLSDGKAHSAQEWKASFSSNFPDLPLQVGSIFSSSRAGDIFLIADKEHTFKKEKAATHGSIIAEDMLIPLVFSGPHLPAQEIETARLTDIYPLVLSWFGLPPSPGTHDGVNPFLQEESDDKNLQELAELDILFSQHPPLLKMIGIEDFAKKEVFPLLQGRNVNALKEAVQRELRRKTNALNNLVAAQKKLEDHPKTLVKEEAVSKKYLADYTLLFSHQINTVRDETNRLNDILILLTKCKQRREPTCENF